MSVAFVFPGQGSQIVGMGSSLHDTFPEARDLFQRADEALGERLSAMCFEGPQDALDRTVHTQPAILTVSLAAHAVVLARSDVRPAFVAGHSLGEWSALVAAGALSFEDAVRAVRLRGQLMQRAVPDGEGAMAAILGLPAEVVEQVCHEVAQGEVVAPANYNAEGQTVVAGAVAAVERVRARSLELGARHAVVLPVSAPFHCALMQPVQARMSEALADVELRVPSVPVVTNVEATPTSDPEHLRSLLVSQIVSPVRWSESVRAMADRGVSRTVELGPGKRLSGMIQRIEPRMRTMHVEDRDSVRRLVS